MLPASIVLAKQQDCTALCDLLALLFEQEADFNPAKEKQKTAIEAILAHPETGHILVLKQDATVFGMVSLLYLPSTAMGGKVALLEDLIIAPQMRHQGYGKLLLEAAVTFARQQNCLRITLLTDKDNLTAQQLYMDQGFEFSAMSVMRKLIKT
ncbi:GNAT family N-acetyltransferase [Methylophaga sp.]|uniref:GNAT family N-acetyltransferase n=1 Tax=Methylophaga sp. TaxID=2024840 RepID=UPI003F6A4063